MTTDLTNIYKPPKSDAEARSWIEQLANDKSGEMHLRWLQLEALLGADKDQLDEPECECSGERVAVWKHFDPLRAPTATSGFREWHVARDWLTRIHDPKAVFDDLNQSFAHAIVHEDLNATLVALSTVDFEYSPFDFPAWVLHGALKLVLKDPEVADCASDKLAVLLRALWFRREEEGYEVAGETYHPDEVGLRLDRFIKSDEATVCLTRFTHDITTADLAKYAAAGLRNDNELAIDTHKKFQFAELSKKFPEALALAWIYDESDLPEEILAVWPESVRNTFDILEGLGQPVNVACATAWQQHRSNMVKPCTLPVMNGLNT
jgi:hypothetical protein